MSNLITINESVFISREPGVVWDFTQDFSKRSRWDKSIAHAKVVCESPARIVDIRVRRILDATLQYKLEERPVRTSQSLTGTRSPLFRGGGGSWHYEPHENGTVWTQTNSLVLKSGFMIRLFRPALEAMLRRSTRQSMKNAKKLIEQC